jgi:hypothetical protein
MRSTPKDSSAPSRGVWKYLIVSLLAFLISAISAPSYLRHHPDNRDVWYTPLDGAIFATVMAAIAMVAFLKCPYRSWIVKAVTFLAFGLSALIAFRSVSSYVTYGMHAA